jgi:hypothetical protein
MRIDAAKACESDGGYGGVQALEGELRAGVPRLNGIPSLGL